MIPVRADSIAILKTVRTVNEPFWAKVVSNILSPPIIWAALALPVAFAYTESAIEAWFWGGYYALFTALIPLLFVVVMLKRGKISDIHMKERDERILPLLFGIISAAFTAFSLHILGAPLILSIFALITAAQLSVIALITIYWQISMHASSIAAATVGVALAFGVQQAIFTVPLILLVTTARLHLRRHTPAQLFAGVLVGVLVPISIALLMALFSL